jgi:hypothetical protein
MDWERMIEYESDAGYSVTVGKRGLISKEPLRV